MISVTLSTGIVVELAPVDVGGQQPATLHEALTSALARIGMQNAAEGAALLREIVPAAPRDPDHWPDGAAVQLRAARAAEVSLLRRACVSPTLAELLATYGGDEADADLGLGPDYALLLDAVRTLSGLTAQAPADLDDARLFLSEWGSGLDGMARRYGQRPSDLMPFPAGALERERLALDLGVYYWARGEDGKDEWWRSIKKEGVAPRR